MGKQSIGELSAIITGQADQLVNELKRTQDAVNSASNATSVGFDRIEKGALKVGVGMMGAMSITRLVGHELRDVIDNIQAIPGVPQDTIDSINQMRFAIEGSNGALKVAAAQLAGKFAETGIGIGVGLGKIVYGADAAADAFHKMQVEADAFANKDFSRQWGELSSQMERLSVQTKGKMAAVLQDEAMSFERFASGGQLQLGKYKNALVEDLSSQYDLQGGATIADRHDAALRALKDRIEAQRTINDLTKQLNDEERTVGLLDDKEKRSKMEVGDAIRQINEQLAELYKTKVPDTSESVDPVQLEKAVEAYKKINALEKEKIQLIQKGNEWVRQFGADLSAAATDAIVDWSNFNDIIGNLEKQIATMIIKLGIVNPMLNAMFGASGMNVTGWTALMTFAGGGDPPVGRASLVGEEGPELFIPKTSGTIIPADMTSSAMSNGRSGDTYYIDATGADPAAIARLSAAISAVNGSIEMRAVAATIRQSQRSVSFRRSIAG